MNVFCLLIGLTWNYPEASFPDKSLHIRAQVNFVGVLIYDNYVAVTGRKRTLFHCKWANSISYNYL